MKLSGPTRLVFKVLWLSFWMLCYDHMTIFFLIEAQHVKHPALFTPTLQRVKQNVTLHGII